MPSPARFDPTVNDYELIDFGHGKKLERFGTWRIARPCPPTRRLCSALPEDDWRPDLVYQRFQAGTGEWECRATLPDPWVVRLDGLAMELRRTPAGQLGVFPEQRPNWQWIRRQVLSAGRPLRVLNLFAYTGGSTLMAAGAGARVVHVDAAKNVVDWARHNASRSGLGEESIQWITEDARKFTAREIRRGREYEAMILDPPTYGHGPRGEAWQITRDLPRLLHDCRQLLAKRPAFFLMTCHSPGWGPPELQAALDSLLFGSCAAGSYAERLYLTTADGRRLRAGAVVRWPGGNHS